MFFKIITICLTFNALRNKNTFYCVYERKCKSSFYVKKKSDSMYFFGRFFPQKQKQGNVRQCCFMYIEYL